MSFPIEIEIAGAAITDVGVFPDRSSVDLAEEALGHGLSKAGVLREEIDGYVWNLGAPMGKDYDVVTKALGLSPRFVVQTWSHGRFTGTCLITAAMAVMSGFASVVACVGGIKGLPMREKDAHSGTPSGIDMFVQPAAAATKSYLDMYNVDSSRLADIVLSARDYARHNPHAFIQDQFSAEDYFNSPVVVDPLKSADCFPTDASGRPINDCGVCVIIRRRSHTSTSQPVLLAGAQGIQGGPDEVYFGLPGLREISSPFSPSRNDFAIYEQSGLLPSDVDGFFTYDAFSPLVWLALERFGHCAPGDASNWATFERISRGGTFPINTNGGILAAGHTSGWSQIVEMVDQLKGDAGSRQIRDVEVLQWGSTFGDSFILTNNDDMHNLSRHSSKQSV